QLATRQWSASIAMDANYLYYTDDATLDDGVAHIDKSGANKKFLAEVYNGGALAVDGTNVYIAPSNVSSTGNYIQRASKNGGSVTTALTLDSQFVGGLVMDNGGAGPTLFFSYRGERANGSEVYAYNL